MVCFLHISWLNFSVELNFSYVDLHIHMGFTGFQVHQCMLKVCLYYFSKTKCFPMHREIFRNVLSIKMYCLKNIAGNEESNKLCVQFIDKYISCSRDEGEDMKLLIHFQTQSYTYLPERRKRQRQLPVRISETSTWKNYDSCLVT